MEEEYVKYYDYLDEYDVRNVLSMIKNGEDLWTPLIQPSMYQQALGEFVRTGKLEKFPSKYVYQWMGIIMKNTAIIRAITEMAGHSVGYPVDEMIDTLFDEDEWQEYKDTLTSRGTSFSPDFGWMECDDENSEITDEDAILAYMEDNGYYDKMTLPDGSRAWSDYGLSPLEEVVVQYNDNLQLEEVLVLINKALDVVHQRGDLSSAFIEGGKATLSKITNGTYVNEEKNKKKIIKINESKLRGIIQESIKRIMKESMYVGGGDFEKMEKKYIDKYTKLALKTVNNGKEQMQAFGNVVELTFNGPYACIIHDDVNMDKWQHDVLDKVNKELENYCF